METSDLTQGALQQLLQSYNPDERKNALERRQQAQAQHLSVLNEPMPDQGPINRMVNDYLTRYAKQPNRPSASAIAAIGAEGASGQKAAENQLLRRQQSAEQEAKYAGEAVKESDAFGRGVMGLIGRKSLGGQPSPEQLRTIYTGLRNEGAQVAKGYDFESATQREEFIEQYANRGMQNYIDNFATQPTGPRGVQPGQPPVSAQITPSQLTTQPSQPLQIPGTQISQPVVNPSMSPPPRNKPEEERKKIFATKTEENAVKDYEENIKPAASMADNMLQSLSIVKQIPRTQDMFAPYREQLGAAMDAIGMDGKMVREAQSLQQIRPILAKIANDRLLLAKGVQTEGDAQRAYNEFLKISDTQKAADFMYAWTEELANRAKFKNSVYRQSAQEEGTWGKGSEWWNKTDYANTAPVAILNGKPWTYSNWRDAFTKANPDASASDVISEWNRLSRKGK